MTNMFANKTWIKYVVTFVAGGAAAVGFNIPPWIVSAISVMLN